MSEKIKDFYETVSFVLWGKIHFFCALIFLLVVIFWWIYYLLQMINTEDVVDAEPVVEVELTWDIESTEPEVKPNPELSDKEKYDLCTSNANNELWEDYDFVWEWFSTTQYSKTEESHLLKWYFDLKDENSILVQCVIESWRFKDTDVKVSFLPNQYYRRDKFLVYKKHCEELWWFLKSQSWVWHWMIWVCWFDDWSSCDLRDFYKWNCRKWLWK